MFFYKLYGYTYNNNESQFPSEERRLGKIRLSVVH